MVRSSNEFCGWCESCFTEEDLFYTRYKTLIQRTYIYDNPDLRRILDTEEWKVCLHCLAQFSHIRSLKENIGGK